MGGHNSMKYVTASALTYDASVGRIEPGQTYYVDDDKAERWIASGIAAASKPRTETPPPQPPPEPDDEGDEEPEPESDEKAQLRMQVLELAEKGQSQSAIADHLGLSRGQVRRLLAS